MTPPPLENIISGIIMVFGIIAAGLYVIHGLKKRKR